MKSLEDLKKMREKALKKVEMRDVDKKYRVVVGMATCGIAAGARPVLNALIEEISRSEDYKIEPLIKEELSKLNKNELEIVIKHIYQNLTFKEILALSKGKYNSINTIKSIYLRAIKKLKERVNK